MADLLQNATHITDIKGIINTSTSHVADEDAAGVLPGEVYVNTTNKNLYIKGTTLWYGIPLTTTSTSSSTSTSTSTSTTAT
jgi:hypothetical protein